MSRITESLYRISGAELQESIEDCYAAATKLVKGKKVEVADKIGTIINVTGLSNVYENDPQSITIKNIDTVEVKFKNGDEEEVEIKDIKGFKNESLNESNFHDGDLRDEFYSLIQGMDPEEIISLLLSYINDYDLDDLIRDAKKGA